MKTLTVKIALMCGKTQLMKKCLLTVPDSVDVQEIESVLKTANAHLCKKDTTGIYRTYGKSPETLLDYVCENEKCDENWSWKEIKTDVDIFLQ